MSVKKREANWGLALIADFLNTAVKGATDKNWRAFLKKPVALMLNPMSLSDAIDLRSDLHEELSFLRLDPRRFKRDDAPYLALIEKLCALQLPTSYQCIEVKKGRSAWPGQTLLRSRDKRRWACFPVPVAHTAREWIYTVLAGAMIRGTMNGLKVCRHCGKYIVVRDIKREFCAVPDCKTEFHNKLKMDSRPRKRKRAVTATAPREEWVQMDCGCRTQFGTNADGRREPIREERCEQCATKRRQRENDTGGKFS